MMLRTNQLAGFDQAQSCIGFGCASLGSRISAKAGLDALTRGFDSGITWYDVAPPYGAGEAEAILGTFLRGRRDKVTVCTKVGLAPPRRNGVLRTVYALGRPVVGVLGSARRAFRKVSATRNVKQALTPELIEASIARSLTRLGTDHVDVLALHDPDPVDVVRPDVVRALERVLARGQARRLGVAGKLPACLTGLAPGLPYSVMQLADDPADESLVRLRQAAQSPILTVTHSVLGVDGARDRLIERLRHDAAARERLAAAGYGGETGAAVSSLLIDRALASNSGGVVLLSMFSGRHLESNLARASAAADERTIALVRQLFAAQSA